MNNQPANTNFPIFSFTTYSTNATNAITRNILSLSSLSTNHMLPMRNPVKQNANQTNRIAFASNVFLRFLFMIYVLPCSTNHLFLQAALLQAITLQPIISSLIPSIHQLLIDPLSINTMHTIFLIFIMKDMAIPSIRIEKKGGNLFFCKITSICRYH